MRLIWDEAKRSSNLIKHGLDFAHARWVLDSRYRTDTELVRDAELRVQSVSYVIEVLAVLTVIHTDRSGLCRIISFRWASKEEYEAYYEWLENQ
jgi:uncharacterized DUF497 family protein